MLAPIMKEVVDENENNILVKVNIDECRKTALENNVSNKFLKNEYYYKLKE